MGAGAGWATTAPSQPGAAVAGVQELSRQQSSLVPFFHWSLPWLLRQLSLFVVEGEATAAPATAIVANNTATLFSFFMFILLIDTTAGAARLCEFQMLSSVTRRAHCATSRIHCNRTSWAPAWPLRGKQSVVATLPQACMAMARIYRISDTARMVRIKKMHQEPVFA